MTKPTSAPRYALATRAIHVGSEPSLSASSSVIPDLSLSTTYEQSSIGIHNGFEYSRSSNPNRLALERLLASLEGADALLEKRLREEGRFDGWQGGPASLSFSSGSAATATVVSGLAGIGGHVVSVSDVYGGTSRYFAVAEVQQNVATTFVEMSYSLEDGDSTKEQEDAAIVARVRAAIRPNTKMIWAETPTNPTLRLVPIALLASIAQEFKIPLIIDNTFSSSFYQNPLALGADVVVHSVTKYLNGHSDVLGGTIISADPNLLERFRFLQNANGNVPSPFDCWLVIRSIKTFTLRAKQHGLNGLQIATWLDTVGRAEGLVRDVFYPGLKRVDETGRQRRERELAWNQLAPEAKRWIVKSGYTIDGPQGFPSGGMVAFHIVSPHRSSQTESGTAERFLEGMSLFCLAESLGGVESLAELPLKMTHAGIPVERRIQLGLDGELVRLSVGVEDGDDLLADVERALRAAVGGITNGKH